MNFKQTFIIFTLFSVVLFIFPQVGVEAEAKTIVVPDDYSTINLAIDSAFDGDIIFVRSGTYNETLLLNKSLSLVGENKETTIINGHNEAPVVYICKDGVNVTGFTLLNGDFPLPHSPDFPWGTRLAGIHLHNVRNCRITGNNIANSGCGIWLVEAHENNISRNYVTNNDYGIRFKSSTNNQFRNNSLSNNLYNLYFSDQTFQSLSGNNIDDSNTANGKTIIYWENKHDSVVPQHVGIIYLINCNTITIQDFDTNAKIERITVSNTNNSKIIGIHDTNINLINSHFNSITENICSISLLRSHRNSITDNLGMISLTYANNNSIVENCGQIVLRGCSFNNIERNNCSGHKHGIQLHDTCNYNSIIGNNLSNNSISGVTLDGGGTPDAIYFPNFNTIIGNNIVGNGLWGIDIGSAHNTRIERNNIIGNNKGICPVTWSILPGGPKALVYNNNFINNTQQVLEVKFTISYNNGYPSGGNYWSDYNGTDNDGDGVGDLAYIINENNVDYFPLIAPIQSFDAGTWEWTPFNVDIVSNSTVSNFSFNPKSNLIRFNVNGERETTGFCRVTIPSGFLDAEGNWIVLLGNNSVIPTINKDSNNTYLYFTYQHSIETIEIQGTNAIPEFPSLIILPLFLILTALVVTQKKRRTKQPSIAHIDPHVHCTY